MSAKCEIAPDKVSSDAGIAGAGVLLSFIVTAFVATMLAASLIIQEQFTKRAKPSTLRRKLLSSYSDQQIMTGIAIQSVGLAKIHTMVPYHFFIIWMLSLLSIATHNTTLLALVHDFRRDWVLRWMRKFLMFVNQALSCVYGIIILLAVQKGVTMSTFPIVCALDGGDHGQGDKAGVSFFGTIAVLVGNVAIFVLGIWYMNERRQRFYRITQLVGLVLMTASAVGATVRVLYVSQAFGEPEINLADQGEKVWSFGQLLSLGMLLLPLVSLVEIVRGEIQCAPPVEDDDDKARLLSNELQRNPRHTYQPNPLWGSRSNLVGK